MGNVRTLAELRWFGIPLFFWIWCCGWINCSRTCPYGRYGSSCQLCEYCHYNGWCNQEGRCLTYCTGVQCTGCSKYCEINLCDSTSGRCRSCPQGRYGDHCNMNCTYCGVQRCDQATGGCLDATPTLTPIPTPTCGPNTYGTSCTPCPANCEGQCDDAGLCLVCQPHYYGSTCSLRCRSTTCSDNKCDKDTGWCTDCPVDHYGSMCQPCPANCRSYMGSLCDKVTGRCAYCSDGKWGDQCNSDCRSDNCLNNRCNQNDGFCSACRTNHYGFKCQPCPEKCLNVAINKCDKDTGRCTDCAAGKWGDECDNNCQSNNCLNNRCNRDNGFCSVCLANHYGSRCQPCPASCFKVTNNRCDMDTGRCTSCPTGKRGDMCNEDCLSDNCLYNRCNQDDGLCSACRSRGFYGSSCQPCPENCVNGRCRDSVTGNGHCTSGCKPGFWGEQCEKQCRSGSCQDNTCDRNTGFCTDCDVGHYGRRCEDGCPPNCKNNACQFYTGDCYSCTPGYWGTRCNQTCLSPNCRDNECYKSNGGCLFCRTNFAQPACNSCESGKYGDNCNKTCLSSDCENNRCDRLTGLCNTCPPGQWGDNCNKSCLPRHCLNNRCDQSTGMCSVQCASGFSSPNCTDCTAGLYGENCDVSCKSSNCADNQCHRQTGLCSSCVGKFAPPNCTACLPGFYSSGCNVTCPSSHCENNQCDQNTGLCAACEDNFLPPLCTDCEEYYFGEDCKARCGKCYNGTSCNTTDGTCPGGCADGYTGPQCLQEAITGANKAAVIAGGVVGAVVIITIIVIIIVVVVRRRREKQLPEDERTWASDSRSNRNQNDSEDVPLAPVATQDANGMNKTDKRVAAPKTKPKPQVAVKPTLFLNKGKLGDFSGHVYMNVDVPSAPLSTQQGASVADDMPADFAEELAEDEGNVYNNEDEVYSTFRLSRPRLDSVQQYLVDRLASGELVEEFKEIEVNSGAPQTAGHLEANVKKNRFMSILPYDSNRVVLKDGYKKHGATDYVNASLIQGYNSDKVYIAAQGPRDNTVADFWRMVWQKQVIHIVMLTNVKELGKDKCFEYWPEMKKSVTHGPVTITGLNTDSRANFEIRTFSIKREGRRDERGVVQYHYMTWPDHGAPIPTALVSFWRYIRSQIKDSASVPILVHCSAGVGRTGTFIGLDLAMDKVTQEGHINVEDVVKQLRQERCYLVQAPEQYIFLHKALLEAYTARDFTLPVHSFNAAFPGPISAQQENSKIDREYQTLTQMRSLMPKQTHDKAEDPENIHKNRNPQLLPPDDHLTYLTEHAAGRNQYINGVFVSTILDLRGCILTQLPLPDTMIDFWRMVWGYPVNHIVSLASKKEEKHIKPYCWYWPRTKDESMQHGKYTITLEGSSRIGENARAFKLKVEKQDMPESRSVQLLRYEDWSGEAPGNTPDLLSIVSALDNAQTKSKGPRTVIQCSDGVSKSGLFRAVCDVVHRMNYDGEVDVYMTVRALQCVRPEVVSSEGQYRYCYEVVQFRLTDSDVYANT